MACFHPLSAYQCRSGEVVFVERERTDIVRSLFLPCGQCVGCRLERSRQWAIRCVHEASLHDVNCFVTLTYDDEHLPAFNSLYYRDVQLWLKRLRKSLNGAAVRYFLGGEYGTTTGRPHYHACLFGYRPSDLVVYRKLSCGGHLFTSKSLEKTWGKGFVTVGDVTFESAAYVARYIMTKVTGDASVEHYETVDVSTGELGSRVPEFCQMSRRPGIAADWLRLFWRDVYPSGTVVVRGMECKPPRFYDKRARQLLSFEAVEHARVVRGRLTAADQTDERLAVRESVALARVARFSRDLEA